MEIKSRKTIYDQYAENPPITDRGFPDKGSTAKHAFWVGYNNGPKAGHPQSPARHAWNAGRKANKDNNPECLRAFHKRIGHIFHGDLD